MKSQLIAALSILFLAFQVGAEETLVLKNQKEKMSYIIGMDIGNNLRKQSIDVDPNILARGIQDGLSAAKPLLSEEEIQNTVTTFRKEKEAKQKEVAKRNKNEGDAFMTANKKKEGVKALASGLQYKVIKSGTGKKPNINDSVTTHYRGTLIDGTEFDSSYKRGQPVTFPVSGVIAGWKEALQLMEEGAKWQLFIPPNLAYGEQGTSGVIGPNATLIFEIELISIQEKK
jgi:FKBP-type peptidyl-prolyl cis-trans isomerase FklB